MKKSLFIIMLGFFLTGGYAMAENSIAVVDLQKIEMEQKKHKYKN